MANKKVKRKLKFNSSRLIISLVLFAISGYLVFSVVQEVAMTINLSSNLQSLNAKLEDIENETRNLQERKEKLEDPNYIKSYARGEYSITKEGEQVFRLPSANSKKDKDASEE